MQLLGINSKLIVPACAAILALVPFIAFAEGIKVIDVGSHIEQCRANQDALQITDIQLKTQEKEYRYKYYAVFDGHGGTVIPVGTAKKELHKILGIKLQEHFNIHHEKPSEEKIHSILRASFIELDRSVLHKLRKLHGGGGGTTVSVVLIDESAGELYVANVGDSLVISGSKGSLEPKLISFDHDPGVATEVERIRDSGGYVMYGRVMASLAITRAIGDFKYKNAPFDSRSLHYLYQVPVSSSNLSELSFLSPYWLDGIEQYKQFVVSPVPEVRTVKMTDDLSFVVLASDGVIDNATYMKTLTVNEAFVTVIRVLLSEEKEKRSAQVAAETLVQEAKLKGGNDDKSAIVIYFGKEQ